MDGEHRSEEEEDEEEEDRHLTGDPFIDRGCYDDDGEWISNPQKCVDEGHGKIIKEDEDDETEDTTSSSSDTEELLSILQVTDSLLNTA